MDAHTAASWGLVNEVVPAAELETATRKLAEQVARASPLVVGIGKQAFYTQIDLDQVKAYGYAKEVMSMNAMAADAQEGISAFLEKRPGVGQGNEGGAANWRDCRDYRRQADFPVVILRPCLSNLKP
jgi:enoyl-CoA hydratase/carnithine racemase